jgi:oligopeptide/dipeptide ABC transporter ATP-binding protein
MRKRWQIRLIQDQKLLDVHDLKVWFPAKKSFLSKTNTYVRAVDGVTFDIRRGEIFCLVGESGCGKTTVANTLLGLVKGTSGSATLNDMNLLNLAKEQRTEFRRNTQMIFQDPYESLNPHMTIFDIVAEPLDVNHLATDPDDRESRVKESLKAVGLNPPEAYLDHYPHQLSGGQRQRVAIASALVLRPSLIVADEPVSMLDISVRAGILKLMLDLRNQFNLTYLFITHDLATARNFVDRIAVMYLGRIIEMGDTKSVVESPLHPYTNALISVVPVPDPKARKQKILLTGEIPSPVEIPTGCRFHTRCPIARESCSTQEPELQELRPGHYAACPFVDAK